MLAAKVTQLDSGKTEQMITERVLSNGMTETEFFNAKRAEVGLAPIKAHVTKIRPGLWLDCPGGCVIEQVVPGGFTVRRAGDCTTHRQETHFVACDEHGQAVCSIAGQEGSLIGVMALDQPFPYGV